MRLDMTSQQINRYQSRSLIDVLSHISRNHLRLAGCVALLYLWPPVLFATEADDYLRDAQRYFAESKYEYTVIQLKNVLLTEPDNVQARLLLGESYIKLKDWASAEKELSRARDLGAARNELLVPLGRAWLMTGQIDKIFTDINVEPGDSKELKVDILVLQGKAYQAKNLLAMADEKFSNAIALEPTSAEALLGKARIAIHSNDMASATGLVDKVLDTHPDNVSAWIMKGDLLRGANKQEEAAAAFQKALDADPGNEAAKLGKATALIAIGRSDEALAEINDVQKSNPNVYLADYLKALALYSQQKYASAQESIQLVLRSPQEYPPAQLLAGSIAYQLGQFTQAEDYLSKYWTRNPKSVQANKLLAAARLQLKMPEKAIEVLRSSSAPDTDAQYLLLLGNAYMLKGDADKGLEYLERAAAVAPDAARIQADVAIAKLSQGISEEGISELQSAVNLDPDLVQAKALLVAGYLQNHDFDKALATVESMEEKLPNNPVLENLKGVAYLGMNNKEAARKAFDDAIRMKRDFLHAYFNLAQLDMAEGNTAAAEQRYRKVLSYEEGNLTALLKLAALADRNGKADEAETWLKKARAQHPQSVEAAVLLAEHYQRQNKISQALDVVRGVAATNPRNAAVLQKLAQLQIQAGEYKNASSTVKTLIEIQPKSPQHLFLLAVTQLEQKDNAAARSTLEKALALQGDYPQAQMALGRLEIAEKHFDAALAIADTLQKNHPDGAYGYELKGDVLAERDEAKPAIDAYALAYSKTPSASLAQKLFHSRMKTGETDSAYAALKQWLADHPEDTAMRMRLASELQSAGHDQQAIEQYLKLLEKDADNTSALNNIAWLYQVTGKPGEARRYAEQAHDLAPDKPEITDTLGWILVQNGETNRGLVLLQEARVKAPHIPDIQYHLAFALNQAGRSAEASKELDRLLKSRQTFSDKENAIALRDQLAR